MIPILIENAMIVPDVPHAWSWAYKFDLGYLIFKEGKITEGGYGKYKGPQTFSQTQIIDAGGLYLAPAMVDLQSNGLLRCDFLTAKPEDIGEAILGVPAFGVGTLMPTIPTHKIKTMVDASINIIQATIQNPNVDNIVVGIHYEGPFLSSKYCGSHTGEYCLTPDTDILHQLMSPIPPLKKKIVTLDFSLDKALELMDVGQRQYECIFFVGHADPNLDPLHEENQGRIYAEAKTLGLKAVTHFGNARGPRQTRTWHDFLHPILDDESIFVLLITDEIHQDSETTRNIIFRNPERVCITTDSLSAAGCEGEGDYTSIGRPYHIGEDGIAWLNKKEHTLIGSTITMDKAISNVLQWCGHRLTLPQIWAMASYYPALVLGMEREIGTLKSGSNANVVLFSWEGPGRQIEIKATFVKGNLLYGYTFLDI